MAINTNKVACPQCAHEADYYNWLKMEVENTTSKYYTKDLGGHVCPICNNTRSISVHKYLIATGQARKAFELEMSNSK